jgi:hypothetical protein
MKNLWSSFTTVLFVCGILACLCVCTPLLRTRECLVVCIQPNTHVIASLICYYMVACTSLLCYFMVVCTSLLRMQTVYMT